MPWHALVGSFPHLKAFSRFIPFCSSSSSNLPRGRAREGKCWETCVFARVSLVWSWPGRSSPGWNCSPADIWCHCCITRRYSALQGATCLSTLLYDLFPSLEAFTVSSLWRLLWNFTTLCFGVVLFSVSVLGTRWAASNQDFSKFSYIISWISLLFFLFIFFQSLLFFVRLFLLLSVVSSTFRFPTELLTSASYF